MPKLTEKQKRFCEEYIVDLNGVRAYIAAYPLVRSDAAARANASRLLTKANIQQYIAELRKEQQRRTEITADTVLGELAKIAATEVDIKGSDKMKALELLGKHLGLFQSSADNSAALEKLDEVLGKIESGF